MQESTSAYRRDEARVLRVVLTEHIPHLVRLPLRLQLFERLGHQEVLRTEGSNVRGDTGHSEQQVVATRADVPATPTPRQTPRRARASRLQRHTRRAYLVKHVEQVLEPAIRCHRHQIKLVDLRLRAHAAEARERDRMRTRQTHGGGRSCKLEPCRAHGPCPRTALTLTSNRPESSSARTVLARFMRHAKANADTGSSCTADTRTPVSHGRRQCDAEHEQRRVGKGVRRHCSAYVCCQLCHVHSLVLEQQRHCVVMAKPDGFRESWYLVALYRHAVRVRSDLRVTGLQVAAVHTLPMPRRGAGNAQTTGSHPRPRALATLRPRPRGP